MAEEHEAKGETNEQVEQKVLALRDSRIGSAIPISMDKITLRDFHLMNIVMKTAWVVPTAMLTYHGTADVFALGFLSYLFYGVYIVDIAASFIEYYKILMLPTLVRMLIPVIKLACILISLMTGAVKHKSYIYGIMGIIYLIFSATLDGLHLFYSELDRIDRKHGLSSSVVESEKNIDLLGVKPEKSQEQGFVDEQRENRFTA